jgi:uncharacterized membrane protein YciS (DUF1049 family)
MRLLFPLLLIVLAVIVVGFVIMNPTERVTVMLPFSAPQTDVPLFLVVFAALAVGVGFTALIAVLEGATIRLANRRLRKEIQRLETQMNFLTTPLPEALEEHSVPAAPGFRDDPAPPAEHPASAPVYDVDPEDSTAETRGG